jgi:hypothetical protein
LYRKVTIETAPIRDDPPVARVTRLPGTNPYSWRPATMQAHTCNLVFLVIQMPLRIRPALLPRILGRRMYKKAPKSPAYHSCSPQPNAITYPASGSSISPISYHSVKLFLLFFVLIYAVQCGSDHYSFFQLCRRPNFLPFRSGTLVNENSSFGVVNLLSYMCNLVPGATTICRSV